MTVSTTSSVAFAFFLGASRNVAHIASATATNSSCANLIASEPRGSASLSEVQKSRGSAYTSVSKTPLIALNWSHHRLIRVRALFGTVNFIVYRVKELRRCVEYTDSLSHLCKEFTSPYGSCHKVVVESVWCFFHSCFVDLSNEVYSLILEHNHLE